MAEAAAATTSPGVSPGAANGGAGAPQGLPATNISAGATIAPQAPSQINMQPANWWGDFKNEELRSYADSKKFTSPEQLVERYKNLESLKGVPDDRLLRLPEKMDGPEAKIVWEKLGTPKDSKGYEFDEKDQDPQFLGWAQDAFFKSNLTKTQGQSLLKEYNDFMTKSLTEQNTARANSILQADEKLKKEWGNEYDSNLNLAKQGARVLGLDAKSLDVLEALQGREALFKTLKGIGVSVGESAFVNGNPAAAQNQMTPEQAQAEIKQLINDKTFAKAMRKGDTEALEKCNRLNQLAAPGQKQV